MPCSILKCYALLKCMQVKKQQLELDMEQQTGSISGKEYVKAALPGTQQVRDMET